MRCHTVLLAAAVVLALSAGVDAREGAFEGTHVRPLDQAGVALLANAQRSSATVRNLVNKLEASDLIVYVRFVPTPAGTPESGLSYMSTTKMARLVMVSISTGCAPDRQIELLGHEFQLAVEIAERSAITTDADFQNVLSVLGWRDSSRARGYETPAANQTQSRVRRELRATAQGQ